MWYPLAGDACWQPARPPFVKQLHVTLPVRCCWKQKTWTVGMETVDNPHARTDTSRREIHEIQFSLEVIIQDARLQTSPHNGSPLSLSAPRDENGGQPQPWSRHHHHHDQTTPRQVNFMCTPDLRARGEKTPASSPTSLLRPLARD